MSEYIFMSSCFHTFVFVNTCITLASTRLHIRYTCELEVYARLTIFITYTHTHTRAHTHTHAHTHIYTHTYTRTHTHACMNSL